ncbi:MAG: Re/Si-specific NAD(P)(+) transhydrogenase subunit alpha [Rhodobacterales bacterium]|nr:Re/Si-specific NAD(P)(+) transhydrogenase subunit alpha [Rhodobacterales bacterium]
MRIAIPCEVAELERRVAATPDTVARMIKMGFEVHVQAGAGAAASYTDAAYVAAGATMVNDIESLWSGAQIICKVKAPNDAEVERLSEGQLVISMLWPKQNKALLEAIAAKGASAIALDKIPRISRAQKMDVLSSMANIAGYRAVLEAAHTLPRFFGGQITAAGKTPPARVLIIGAGVAGLAAIGAARGLGADVWAFDTREATREQVESMGGKFLELKFEESGEGKGGYAKLMSKEFIEAEMALFKKNAPKIDIVITTALIPGRAAPLLWKAEHVELMKPGSVVVDMAAVQGGNCEVTVPGEHHIHKGVHILGYTDLTSRLPNHASQFFARNITHLLSDMGGAENWAINLEDEVVRGAIAVHNGELVPPPPPPEPSPQRAVPAQQVVVKAKVAKVVAPPASHATVTASVLGLSLLLAIAGNYAPDEGGLLQHLTVFVLACFVGWQVVWNVTAALHTPLMSVTNAISGIIVVGGIIQAGSGNFDTAAILGAVAILFASINIAGGFLVTQRMLAMFRR